MPMQAPSATTQTPGIHPRAYRLPASARVGRVRLAVSSLDRSLAFYGGILGLAVLSRTGNLAMLGAASNEHPLLELEQQPGLHPLHSPRLGLYHTAILLPSRADLSSLIHHLRRHRVPFAASDHLVSEALYLTDPDGLTVEVYADRDRALWRFEGPELAMDTRPLRFADMPQVAEDSWQGAPAGTTVGHVHLYIGDLENGARFYHAGLGMDITTARFPGALFLSAGGYHHHIGINAWAAGSPVASASDPRLVFWELVVPSGEEAARVGQSLQAAGFAPHPAGETAFSDPWGITVRLVAA